MEDKGLGSCYLCICSDPFHGGCVMRCSAVHFNGSFVAVSNLGGFYMGDVRSCFDVGVKILTLNPMVEFLTSAHKKTARHPM